LPAFFSNRLVFLSFRNLNRLYGRDKESEIVQSLADEESTNILVLHGKAGSGKSYLIENQPWDDNGWLFACGKYEQRRSNEPYSALISALNDLVDQWAINNANQPVCKMGAFHELLEEDVVFLRHILPKAFKVGKHSSCQSENIAHGAVKRRSGGGTNGGGAEYVNASFWRILSFLCKPRPVVLFLDDVQWADVASLEAIKFLATSGQVEGLLLVLAYRDDEVNPGDSVAHCLDFVHKNGGDAVHGIHLTDLDLVTVNEIVSYLLQQNKDQTMDLAQVVFNKTLGNAFFVIQFLQMLRNDRFLTFSLSSLKWEWGNVDKIKAISDNVADVVASTMKKLPLPTQVALKASSCLGKVIPLTIMVEFFNALNAQDECVPLICEALKSIHVTGLKEILDSAVNYGILTRSDDGEIYTWAHDKLQLCAYMMIQDDIKSDVHGVFGQLLWKMSASYPDDDWILYMAADQMNRSSLVGKDESFAEDVARLSYEAAKLTMYKSAFFPAFQMTQGAAKALAILKDPWSKAYSLTLFVYSGMAEVGVRLGMYEEARTAISEVLTNAKTIEDRFRALSVSVRCQVSGSSRDYAKGIELMQAILMDYGVKFPDKLLPGQQFVATRRLKARLERGYESLLNLRHLDDDIDSDRRHHHIVAILVELSLFCYMCTPRKMQLAMYATTRALNTSIKHGICAETAVAISGAATMMLQDGNPVEARELCGIAVKLVNSFPKETGSPHAEVYAGVTASVLSAIEPFNKTLDSWLEVNKIGLRNGDTENASMGLVGYSFTYLCVGLPLPPFDVDLAKFIEEANEFGMAETVSILFPMCHQTVKNLTVEVPDPTVLKGELFDEDKSIEQFTGQGLEMTRRDVDSFKLFLACIFNRWDEAAKLVDALEKHLNQDRFVARHHLRLTYVGVASVILGRVSTRRKGHYRQLGNKVTKMWKAQIKNGSQNAFPLVVMLEALESPSKSRFDEAIRTCARLGLRQHQALLYEHAALDCIEKGDDGLGEYYLSQACNLYNDWGAKAKTERLKRDHHSLLKKSSLNLSSSGSSIQGRSRYNPAHSGRLKEVNWSTSSFSHDSQRSSEDGSSFLGRKSASDGSSRNLVSPS
jgi:predicted ATPase